MPPLKDQAIVLRHLDYSETSQVLACLTRLHGPRRLIAKGIKRSTKKGKPSAAIDLLEYGEMVFIDHGHSGEGLAILTEWQQTDAHLGLRDNLRAWYAGQYAAEITSAMTEEADPHPELFDALAGLLQALAAGSPPLISIVSYQCALLIAAGLWPDLDRCVMCNRPAPSGRAGYYAAVQGGLVCRQCEPQLAAKQFVSSVTLDALRSRQFDAATAEQAFAILDATIATAVGRPMSLATAIQKWAKLPNTQ